MNIEDKWKCPWCGQIATSTRQSICDSRQCDCGAIVLGTPEIDYDEITDEALHLFAVPIRPESRGYDSLLRNDIQVAGIEIKQGIQEKNLMTGWNYVYMWFRRTLSPETSPTC